MQESCCNRAGPESDLGCYGDKITQVTATETAAWCVSKPATPHKPETAVTKYRLLRHGLRLNSPVAVDVRRRRNH
jgi:hypothetical protein